MKKEELHKYIRWTKEYIKPVLRKSLLLSAIVALAYTIPAHTFNELKNEYKKLNPVIIEYEQTQERIAKSKEQLANLNKVYDSLESNTVNKYFHNKQSTFKGIENITKELFQAEDKLQKEKNNLQIIEENNSFIEYRQLTTNVFWPGTMITFMLSFIAYGIQEIEKTK